MPSFLPETPFSPVILIQSEMSLPKLYFVTLVISDKEHLKKPSDPSQEENENVHPHPHQSEE